MSRIGHQRAAITLGMLLLSTIAARWTALDRLPGHPTVTVRVNDKPRSYFRLTSESPLTFELRGPGRLRIVSRALFGDASAGKTAYQLTLSEGSTRLKAHSAETSPAPAADLEGDDGQVGRSRSTVVSIPKGRHRLTLTTSGSPAVLVRLLFAKPGRKARAMVSLTPYGADRSVTVSEGERLIPYYSVLPGKPVRLKVIGPTRVELTCRLDFDSTMRGSQLYRLRISQNGRPVREASFKTTKATTASYVDLKDRVASKLDRIVIPVREGSHELTVELVEPKRGSAEVRARIPRPTEGRAP